jgi:glutathione peroxidase-family protein/uncharacterized membrane protein
MKTSALQNIFRIILGAVMILAGIAHVSFAHSSFQAQIPSWLTTNAATIEFIIVASGIVEIFLGIFLIFLQKHNRFAGWALAFFFILIFPGNIHQYTSNIDAFGLDSDNKRLFRLFFQPVLISWALWSTGAFQKSGNSTIAQQQFYDFTAKDINGNEVSMKNFAGKTIVIVNTASNCGFTPQYKALENLYRKYKADGLVILGFPCNQFGKQEPGNAEEIAAFCERNYGVSFMLFEKVNVKGKNAHPIFQYLTAALPSLITNSVKWNFTKFIIDKNGKPVKRFAPTTKPEAMEKFIREII